MRSVNRTAVILIDYFPFLLGGSMIADGRRVESNVHSGSSLRQISCSPLLLKWFALFRTINPTVLENVSCKRCYLLRKLSVLQGGV